jgi:GAF domain-containing protein
VTMDGLDLVEMSRLAMCELDADAVLVECRGGVAVLGGPADEELLTAVRHGSGGDGRVMSTGDGDGAVHVLHRTAPDDPDRCRELLEAFTRHIAVILGRGAAHPDTDRDGVLAVDDLPLLPDAVTAITGRVAEMMQPLTGATAAGITVWDAEHGILRALPGAFGATDDVVAASVTGPVTNQRSATSRVLTTGQPYLSNCASGDPGILQPYVEIFEITRILSVPLNNGGRRIGVLHLVNKPSDFTTDDITATERVTPRIAIAVELALAVARMSAQQRLEGVLAAVAVAIATGRGVEDGLLPAFEQLADVTAAVAGRPDPAGLPAAALPARRAGPRAGAARDRRRAHARPPLAQ